ncbi:hypothetical protein MPSEU_000253400 [Mayamaea pseudoterrestris]|nr:hypothetical protein MPSEU_000253400 [Mayamaea pseudoterrestris]
MRIAVCWLLVGLAQAAMQDDEPCRLWLARSHLYESDAPKYGLYAGVTFKVNDTLPNMEIGIPMVDFQDGPHSSTYPEIMQALETFFWTADYAGTAKWEGNHSSTILVPGVGVLANYHAGYSNIDWVQSAVFNRQYPEAWTRPSSQPHPSRGATSSYFNMTMRASADIPVGMELFANFGEVWDPEINKDDVYEQLLTRWDYQGADAIMKRMNDYLTLYKENLSGELGLEVVDFMRESILGPHHGRRAKSIRSLLPATPKKIHEASQLGGTFLYRNQDMIKSPDWLEDRGVCVDTLEVKPSTKKDAGFGAFATRDFDVGDIISVSPMITMYKDMFDMYRSEEVNSKDDEKKVIEFDLDTKIGEQLAMNYAFGHSESSVVFLPTSPYVAYMNHDSEEFNAYVDWSEHDDVVSRDELTAGTLQELKYSPQLSAVFQIVAVQDIKKGDEVLINYGAKWEEAWQKYKRARRKTSWTQRAMDVAKEYADKPYPVDLKVGKIPYPEGVITACFIKAEEVEDGRPKVNTQDQQILQWTGPRTDADMNGMDLVICDLVDRDMDEKGSYTYTVKARVKGTNEIAQVEGVAHAAVTLTDRPYTSDMHAPGAFRHWIEIDDQRFPQHWRDLRS